MKEGRMQKIFLFLGFSIFLIFGARAANAATLYFSPSSGNFSVGNILTVNILVNTENADINNAEATVNFPSGLLEIVSISKSGSIFTLWVEDPTFSNNAGTLSFNGGLPTPGFNSTNGKILSAVFRVKRAGSATVAFSSPAVRANDGYGTNVFRVGAQAQFNLISEERPTPPPTEEASPVATSIPRPVIRSTTHPDEDKWYSNNNPLFKWDVPAGVTEVLLVLNRSAGSVPFVSYTPPISERTLEDLAEGTWYFNARFRTAAGLGPISSFRVNIDTQPPTAFGISRLDTSDLTNPRPVLLFESSDATSGIDRYEIKVGEGEWVRIEPALAGRAYAIPLQKYGNYAVEIKALDKAGNFTSAKIDVQIEPIKASVITEITKEAGKGKPVTVKGTAEPERKIIIEFVRNGNGFINLVPRANTQQLDADHFIYETTADENGNWAITITDLPTGRYKVAARAQDERQAISEMSNEIETRVKGGFWDLIFSIFDWFVNVLSGKGLFIAFLAVSVGLLLALTELIKVHAGKNIKKLLGLILVKIVRNKSIKKVGHIIKDMEDELEYLKRIEKRRFLNTEEKYLKSKISAYLKMLKHIDKEIHNKE